MGIQWWETSTLGRKMGKTLTEGLCGDWHLSRALSYGQTWTFGDKKRMTDKQGNCGDEGTEVGKVLDMSQDRECWVGHLESKVGKVSVAPNGQPD